MVGNRRQQLPDDAVSDPRAVAESLGRYHQALMRELRLRLRDPRLRQALQRGYLKPFFAILRLPVQVETAES
jgi:hypothetical protein